MCYEVIAIDVVKKVIDIFECLHCRKFLVVNEVEVQDSQPEQGESLLAWRVLIG